jgi:N-methylhydantoinase B
MKSDADPVLLEVLRNELMSVTEEMAACVQKTGRSPLLQSGEAAAALADSKGRPMGLGRAYALVVGYYMSVMAAVIERWGDDLHPGDVLMCSAPHHGGSHKPDVFVVTPVFLDGAVVAFALTYSHQNDVGGRFPGGFSAHAVDSYDEGLHVPNLKIYERGNRNDALLELLESNIRSGADFISDLEAKVAGCQRGAEELQDLFRRYGTSRVQATFDYMFDYAERESREFISGIPDGEYQSELLVVDHTVDDGETELLLKVCVRVAGDELTVDFAGAPQQVNRAINNPINNTLAIVYKTIHQLLGPDVPFNEGFARPIKVITPSGSILNPTFPAAVGGRASVFVGLQTLMCLVMAEATPNLIPVPSWYVDLVHVNGNRGDGTSYAAMDLIWNSWGGRPGRDGIDGAGEASHGAIPIELQERYAPIVVEEVSLRPDSGGPGEYRGGLGLVKQFRFLEDAQVAVRTNSFSGKPFGLAGGEGGAAARNLLIKSSGETVELPAEMHLHIDVSRGDALRHECGGAGGFGEPALRDPELIARDLSTGRLTPEAAHSDYGYVAEMPPAS